MANMPGALKAVNSEKAVTANIGYSKDIELQKPTDDTDLQVSTLTESRIHIISKYLHL